MASAMPIIAGPKANTLLPQNRASASRFCSPGGHARVKPAGRNDQIVFLGCDETGGYIHECVPRLSLSDLV